MSSLVNKLRTETQLAVAAASHFLIEHQDSDGYWRDYELEPGRSEAWITGCVGYALCNSIHTTQSQRIALHRAAGNLLASCKPAGWGYNHQTACDADSTSWVIRFLVKLGALNNITVLSLLNKYVTPIGTVRTFHSFDRFGSWAMEHDEVAPLAGLALLDAGELRLASQIRSSVLSGWVAGYGWKSFWWSSGAYASAQNLDFLSASGGIPGYLATDERARLCCILDPESAFEVAQRLAAAVHVNALSEALHFNEYLLELQLNDGGWPSSPGLLVRNQREPSQFRMFSDDRRLFSTAISVITLTLWLCRQDADDAATMK